MRGIIGIALLSLVGCNVDNDPGNDQVTVKYDEAKIKKSAATAGRAAEKVGTGIANVAKGTGEAINLSSACDHFRCSKCGGSPFRIGPRHRD